jgi:hypothetical protein
MQEKKIQCKGKTKQFQGRKNSVQLMIKEDILFIFFGIIWSCPYQNINDYEIKYTHEALVGI